MSMGVHVCPSAAAAPADVHGCLLYVLLLLLLPLLVFMWCSLYVLLLLLLLLLVLVLVYMGADCMSCSCCCYCCCLWVLIVLLCCCCGCYCWCVWVLIVYPSSAAGAEVGPGMKADSIVNGTVLAASPCPYGTYNPGYETGFTCTQCPQGTTTQTRQSAQSSDCCKCGEGHVVRLMSVPAGVLSVGCTPRPFELLECESVTGPV
jgi:hypothetical protein